MASSRISIRLPIAVAIVAVATFALGPEEGTRDLTPREAALEELMPDLGGDRKLVAGGWDLRSLSQPPEVVFLGNSMVSAGIDTEQFTELTGRRAGKLWSGSSASAWWYVALKGVIVNTEPRPKLVVLCFRDHHLTYAALVRGGRLEAQVDEALASLPGRSRTTAAGQRRDPLRAALSRHWSLLAHRQELRNWTEASLKSSIERAAGAAPGTVDAAIDRLFARELLDRDVLTRAQLEADKVEDSIVYDFDAMLETSFLPDLIAEARAQGINLVLVRMRRSPAGNAVRRRWADHLERYAERMTAYLEDADVPFLDFSAEESIRQDHFSDYDHLGADGKAIFTRLLADRLEPHLPTTTVKARL